jgi:hypothetical protein
MSETRLDVDVIMNSMEMATETSEIVSRRFGRDHEKPCKRPDVLTCAMWPCQSAGECQADDCGLPHRR